MRQHLLDLRQLVFDVSDSNTAIGELVETLKWGEPGYLAKGGSTIRLGVPKSQATLYAMYFNCNSRLVESFREVYPTEFTYEGNRALVFEVDRPIETDALKHCIEVALRYHRVKHRPLLGM